MAVGSHTEVETKLAVTDEAGASVAALLDDDAGLLALPGVAGVDRPGTVELVATYHDTTDLRLARSRATLRRRTGGADEGWHLKLPGREDSRTEVHEPLGDDAAGVPDRLVDLTRSRHRGAGIGPVAVLRTRRTEIHLLDHDARVLAEIADDEVTAEVADVLVAPGHPAVVVWHEVEVELVSGGRDLLAAAVSLLRDAGAEPAASPSKLARALGAAGARPAVGATGDDDARRSPRTALDVALVAVGEHVRSLVEEDPHVRLDSPDSVHKARVATRRLRSTLATFRPQLDRDVTEPVRDRLKDLGSALGGARDAEVLSARLQGRLAGLPPELVPGPVAARLQADLDGGYEREREVAVAALDAPEHADLLDRLEALVLDPPRGRRADDPARKGTRRRARKAVRRLEDRLGRVPAEVGPERDAALHEVRKAAKRVRYAGEALTGVHGKKAARLASRAEDLQDLLGEHQDAVVATDRLRDMALRAHADGENTFGYGLLAGLEHARTAGLDPDDPALVRALRRLRKAARRWPG
ncbi:CHAD domain-containing protein [Aquipuribacter nitratireducens]|uniref:CHAD domain-containing protein n=1 Tax=Aquipuribacter nitratireducens TaxID=650104 RepID=A0ABW0GJ79_9MICO